MTQNSLGWQVFAADPAVLRWVSAVCSAATASLKASERRHDGTWAPGVDALDNDANGRVGTGPALAGRALDAAQALFGPLPLHKAQVSGVYPGYPRQDPSESAANHRFRQIRDAAHLDGLLPIGPDKRRYLIEPHAWILGLPLAAASETASPLVVYENSHHVIRAALAPILSRHAPADWSQIDLTAPYQAARKQVFETCRRVTVPVRPGEATLLHRMTIHGVAPWTPEASAAPDGRLIAYFRPQFSNPQDWLDLP